MHINCDCVKIEEIRTYQTNDTDMIERYRLGASSVITVRTFDVKYVRGCAAVCVCVCVCVGNSSGHPVRLLL